MIIKKILICLLVVSFFSCRKEIVRPQANQTEITEAVHKSNFGQVLFKTLQSHPELRNFVKQESLKRFDNDYDVLFASVKAEKINGEQTFYDLLVKNAESQQKLDAAIKALPLLTLFVPDLPELSPEMWDAINQIPQIAIEPILGAKTITYFNSQGKNEQSIDLIPGTPTIVIKNNERVVVKGSPLDLSNQYINSKEEFVPYITVDGISYVFTGRAFDNRYSHMRTKPSLRTGTNNPSTNTYTIDKVNIDAYQSGVEWHRDYVYYGIDPNNGVFNGDYRNNFHEFVKSFKFLSTTDYDKVSDDEGDPKMWPRYPAFGSYSPWIEGAYEFYIDIVVNAKNGTGAILHKSFTCNGSDLWTPVYKKAYPYYILESYSTKEYNPNLDLIPWDLENYGNAWKFIVSEYDPTTTTTKTVTHTSTFGSNFEIGVTGIKKIGPKFGGSSTSTTTTTLSYTYTVGSDDLSEGIIAFDYGIITSLSGTSTSQYYSTYETSTGRVSFSVEPARVF